MDAMHKKKFLYILSYSGYGINYRVKKLTESRDVHSKYSVQPFFYNDRPSSGSRLRPYHVFHYSLLERIIHKGLKILRIKNVIEKKFLFFSYRFTLINRLFKTVVREVKTNRPNMSACLFVCPPHDLLVCAKKMKKKYPDVRMVIDWQDLLSYDEYYFSKHPKWKKERMRRLEGDVLHAADMNVFTNYKAKNWVMRQFDVPPGKCFSIVHPFDKKELPSREVKYFNKKIPQRGIKYGFLGGLFKDSKVPGEKFLSALKHVVTRIDHKAVFHIWGTSYRVMEKRYPSIRGLRDHIFIHDFIPHEKALSELQRCDVLVLILGHVPNADVVMHAKLPHYLALGRPILAFVPENSFAKEIIDRTQKGYVVSDIDWVKGFADFYKNFDKISPEADKNEVDSFTLDKFVESWTAVLDRRK